jgi:hypothetical protein
MDEEKQNEHHVRAFYEATAVLRQNIVSPSHLGIPIQRRDCRTLAAPRQE